MSAQTAPASIVQKVHTSMDLNKNGLLEKEEVSIVERVLLSGLVCFLLARNELSIIRCYLYFPNILAAVFPVLQEAHRLRLQADAATGKRSVRQSSSDASQEITWAAIANSITDF
jgi:hypothetical protein